MSASRVGGVAALAGVATFVGVVVSLHLVQPGYSPSQQLMSELALGPHGGFMFLAFAGIGMALLGVQFAIATLDASRGLRGLLAVAAAFFFAAGFFPLGESSTIHIAAIAAAFVCAVLAIYLFPALAGRAAALAPRAVSWSMAAGVAASVALGNSILSMGIGQRLAAAFLLLWLAVLGWRLATRRAGATPSGA